MVLRLIALLFGVAALMVGLVFGWSLALGELVTRTNAGVLRALDEFVRRVFWAGAWESVFSPLFAMPAWSAPAAVGFVLFAIAAVQPGHH